MRKNEGEGKNAETDAALRISPLATNITSATVDSSRSRRLIVTPTPSPRSNSSTRRTCANVWVANYVKFGMIVWHEARNSYARQGAPYVNCTITCQVPGMVFLCFSRKSGAETTSRARLQALVTSIFFSSVLLPPFHIRGQHCR